MAPLARKMTETAIRAARARASEMSGTGSTAAGGMSAVGPAVVAAARAGVSMCVPMVPEAPAIGGADHHVGASAA